MAIALFVQLLSRDGVRRHAAACPDTKEKLAREGVSPSGITPEQFAAMIEKDIGIMAKIVKAANVRID